ncbi:hypothetical protein K503DRAFT_214759 [Rhizopogon vinicolor AM-OR11-026]|uniref:Uncharacterized protein n=1 Tax=Rhizopogon vinicolor AM-OR11-026 TaxID=1314800 RepID=A0A1B7MYQ0_9AGAM|nr:hypothetical protein K503DRAFT_214759 [Rhizopogon vinicolor AM-OR11-026]
MSSTMLISTSLAGVVVMVVCSVSVSILTTFSTMLLSMCSALKSLLLRVHQKACFESCGHENTNLLHHVSLNLFTSAMKWHLPFATPPRPEFDKFAITAEHRLDRGTYGLYWTLNYFDMVILINAITTKNYTGTRLG